MSKKIMIITNIPSPYRVDFFSFIQNEYIDLEFNFLFTNLNENNRKWNVELNKLDNAGVLDSPIIQYQKNGDTKYIHFPKRLFDNLKMVNPDIIISSEYNIAAIMSLIWAKVKMKKFINLTDGTLNSEKDINYVQKILRKAIILQSDGFIASSTKAKEKLLAYGADSKKIFISYLTEDLKEYLEYNIHIPKKGFDRTVVLLYVGQIIERKGIDLLLKALSKVNTKYILNIVGSGNDEYMDYIKRIIENLKINKNKINFKGFKEGKDLIEEYSNCDIFVFPTRCDCYGLVMLEAFAMGKYQIVSKFADGAYDIIDDNSGIIIDPYNVEEFSRVLEDKISNVNNISVSKDKLEKFDFKNTAKPFIDAINSVI